MICYRQLTNYLPTYLAAGAHWQVEYWPEVPQLSPSGLAWCTIRPESKWIDSILVRDDQHRCEVAARLIKACHRRWPAIEFPGAINHVDEVLLQPFDLAPSPVLSDGQESWGDRTSRVCGKRERRYGASGKRFGHRLNVLRESAYPLHRSNRHLSQLRTVSTIGVPDRSVARDLSQSGRVSGSNKSY